MAICGIAQSFSHGLRAKFWCSVHFSQKTFRILQTISIQIYTEVFAVTHTIAMLVKYDKASPGEYEPKKRDILNGQSSSSFWLNTCRNV